MNEKIRRIRATIKAYEEYNQTAETPMRVFTHIRTPLGIKTIQQTEDGTWRVGENDPTLGFEEFETFSELEEYLERF